LQDTELKFAHVGDSRLYRVTQRHGLEQLTVDHEVGQRNIAKGMSPQVAYARPDAFQLTQALGPRPEQALSIEVQTLNLTEDTLFLFCSDGLTDDHLLERNWESHLKPLLDFQTPLDEGVEQLIQLANQENGHDNITIIAVRAQVELRTISHSLGQDS
ncbi:MAG TPA: SpoIIE family protein phosphatase, partial [Stenomitos sp.]